MGDGSESPVLPGIWGLLVGGNCVFLSALFIYSVTLTIPKPESRTQNHTGLQFSNSSIHTDVGDFCGVWIQSFLKKTAMGKILQCFGRASELLVNFTKCSVFPIACHNVDLDSVLQRFGGDRGQLPCSYLGLPLSLRKPRRIEVQPLIEKISGKLKTWKGKLLSRQGRLTLINSVLSASTTYFLTCFAPSAWIVKKIDRLRRAFLWSGEEETNGSKCLVNWKTVCAPKICGGLGVKDLRAFGRALRLRWAWHAWDSAERPWKGMKLPCEPTDMALFAACAVISVGNGERISFWHDNWTHDSAFMDMAPELYKLARFKKISLSEAVGTGRWIRGLHRLDSLEMLQHFISFWEKVQGTTLNEEEDSIRWKFDASGVYTAKSAYEVQFLGRTSKVALNSVWSVRCEGKIRFFLWLLFQNRLWTGDRLASRGWPHGDICCFCDQVLETARHLILDCPFSKEIWASFLRERLRMCRIVEQSTLLIGWWSRLLKLNSRKKNPDIAWASMVVWHIWKERNQRIFKDCRSSSQSVASVIRSECALLLEECWE